MDEKMRAKWDRFAQGIRVNEGNAFGYIAVRAAYEEGRPWFDELLGVIEGNYRYFRERIEAELPDARVTDHQGTYLLWVDFSAYMEKIITMAAEKYSTDRDAPDAGVTAMQHLMEDECGIAVDYGAWFGGGEYAGCIRINLATCRENIGTAADRIIEALKK